MILIYDLPNFHYGESIHLSILRRIPQNWFPGFSSREVHSLFHIPRILFLIGCAITKPTVRHIWLCASQDSDPQIPAELRRTNSPPRTPKIPQNWFSDNGADWVFGTGSVGDASSYFKIMVFGGIAYATGFAIRWGFRG